MSQHRTQQQTPGQHPHEPENGQPGRSCGMIPPPPPRAAAEAYGVADGPTDASAVNPGMFRAITWFPGFANPRFLARGVAML